MFTENYAKHVGGAIVSILESFILIGGDSKVTFHNNNGTDAGGAVSIKSCYYIYR